MFLSENNLAQQAENEKQKNFNFRKMIQNYRVPYRSFEISKNAKSWVFKVFPHILCPFLGEDSS